MRLLGFVLFVLGLVMLALDWSGSEDPANVVLRPLGELWFQIHSESLLALQPAVERYVSTSLWTVIQSILEAPAAIVFGALGLILLLVSRVLARRRGA